MNVSTVDRLDTLATHMSWLNEAIAELDNINTQYPRRVGTMVMVSDDTENRISALLDQMDDLVSSISQASPEDMAECVEDGFDYPAFLDETRAVIAANRVEVARAREFLSRYYSH